MANLRTNYKDDVPDTSKNEKRKYRMIQNEDGTVSFEDETEYTQLGDTFGAADFNKTNEEVNALNEGIIHNDVRTGVVAVLPNGDISISDNTPINFKDYVPLAATIISTYGSSDAHSQGMLGSPAIKDNTTCCVRYKNLTESELKVDFTVRFYYLRNN